MVRKDASLYEASFGQLLNSYDYSMLMTSKVKPFLQRSEIKMVFLNAAPGGNTPPVLGILELSLRIVVAANNKATHVAPYPGLVPVTFVIIFLFIGVSYLSVGSARVSFHPSPENIISKTVFSIDSSVGPSCETKPNVNAFGCYE